MDTLFSLAALFTIGGTLGWCLELVYRRLISGKWINPGFLVGPCLPLYGTGLVVLYLLCSVDLGFIANPALSVAVRLVVMMLVLTAIEFVTGLIFTKVYHVKLWDYSDLWGNIRGIVCPLYTLLWGLLGAAYFFFLHGIFSSVAAWFAAHPSSSFFLGMYFGVFGADIGYSFRVVTHIRQWASEHDLEVRYEHLKLSIRRHAEQLSEKWPFQRFLFSFPNRSDLMEELEQYRKWFSEQRKWIEEKREKIHKNRQS